MIYTTLLSYIFVALSIIILIQTITLIRLNNKKKACETDLERNGLLLSELHHRLKNNLQLLTGLIDHEFKSKTNVNEIHKSIDIRIESMGYIHDILLTSREIKEVQANNFFYDLSITIIKYQILDGERLINIYVKNLDIKIPIKLAVDIGLFINEFLTNAIKYGFEKNKPYDIKITAKKSDNKITKIKFQHNGRTPEDSNINMNFLELMAKQMNAELNLCFRNKEFKITLHFNN